MEFGFYRGKLYKASLENHRLAVSLVFLCHFHLYLSIRNLSLSQDLRAFEREVAVLMRRLRQKLAMFHCFVSRMIPNRRVSFKDFAISNFQQHVFQPWIWQDWSWELGARSWHFICPEAEMPHLSWISWNQRFNMVQHGLIWFNFVQHGLIRSKVVWL